MKNVKLLTFLAFVACLLAVQPASAVMVVKNHDAVTLDEANMAAAAAADKMTKKELRKQNRMLKKQQRMQKRMERLQRFLEKRGADVDFSDPVDKWMWFWIFGWGAGILLTILAPILFVSTASVTGLGAAGILWLLASLAYLFGTVSLVIWLVKKFG
jgi:hypothetical protein